MAVLVSKGHETAKLEKVNRSLDHEHRTKVKTNQLLADLKDKEAVAREMIAILRGVRGPDAWYERKAARRVLARVKQRRVLAKQSLRRSQNRVKGLEAQSANVNHAAIKKAQDLCLDAGRICIDLSSIEPPPITAEIGVTATHAVGHPVQTAHLCASGGFIGNT